MEIDPVEMMALCVALLDHVAAVGTALPGLDDGGVAAALSDLTEGLDTLMADEEMVGATIDAQRPMVGEMPAEDMQEGAAFCVEMAQEL